LSNVFVCDAAQFVVTVAANVPVASGVLAGDGARRGRRRATEARAGARELDEAAVPVMMAAEMPPGVAVAVMGECAGGTASAIAVAQIVMSVFIV